MDKVEQVARIIDNALMADMVDGRFNSIGYARQIVALFEPASPNRPKIVCLCGSGRFKEAFEQAEFIEG